ncbi:MAG: hypothetical protein UC928_08265 [Collinsella sp.]|nr:hypothetical protein [Collinsella sp.]
MESTVKQGRFISAMLLATLSVVTIMAAISAFSVANKAREALFAPTPLYINGESIPASVTAALTIRDVIVLALSIACLLIYLRFCLDVVNTQSIFTRKQCRRLLVVGLLLLISSVVSIAFDSLCAAQLPNNVSTSVIGIFGFNAWTLVLALFALSLSAIFEYGRLLQSDVDAII